MKIGKSYRLVELLLWTRRKLYVLFGLSAIPCILYEWMGPAVAVVPWAVAAMVGTATSFIVGFKNAQTYNRMVDAQATWATIASTSRCWGVLCSTFVLQSDEARTLINRHLAWLTVVRHYLRRPRPWETRGRGFNTEYQQKYFDVPEDDFTLASELRKYLTAADVDDLHGATNRAGRLILKQSMAIRSLCDRQLIPVVYQLEMMKTLKELMDLQGKAERIKNFPYPRQYAAINTIFVWCFAVLLPFCLLREFDRLADGDHHLVWLAMPVSALIAWMYLALDQVGESTENPFEGGANDVPISQICRHVEREMLDTLGETDLPPLLQPRNEIVL